ncbi:MAG: hypothetical protein HY587_01120 [Candidatus Omnitrophica bacterium]|nr:hypothetical protein [Candidatus Omnitrophota bacterium]
MGIKTVRFNKEEEAVAKKILAHYHTDFSDCVKRLLAEKFEDLQDIGVIRRIREGNKNDYLTGGEIDKLFLS